MLSGTILRGAFETKLSLSTIRRIDSDDAFWPGFFSTNILRVDMLLMLLCRYIQQNLVRILDAGVFRGLENLKYLYVYVATGFAAL